MAAVVGRDTELAAVDCPGARRRGRRAVGRCGFRTRTRARRAAASLPGGAAADSADAGRRRAESGVRPWFGRTPPPLGFFTAAPAVLGQTFDGPMEGHNPAMPWHYDLHVWLWKSNPTGLFTPFNPDLSCT